MSSVNDLLWSYLNNKANSETVYAETSGGIIPGPWAANTVIAEATGLPGGMYEIDTSFSVFSSVNNNPIQIKVGTTVKFEVTQYNLKGLRVRVPAGSNVTFSIVEADSDSGSAVGGYVFLTKVMD